MDIEQKVHYDFIKDYYENFDVDKEEYLFNKAYKLYYFLDLPSNDLFNIYATSILMIAYEDMFLLLNHKKKEGILTMKDFYNIYIMDGIEDYTDLKSEVSANPDFFVRLLDSIIEFGTLGLLGKKNLVKTLSDNEKDYLKNISSFHDEYEKYSEQMDTKEYIEYFGNRAKLLSDDEYKIDTSNIIEEITGYIINLSKYDYENYANNVKDLLIYYYEWVKYDSTHDFKLFKDAKDDNIIFINAFEETSLEELISDSVSDFDFVWTLVSFYIEGHYTNSKYNCEKELIIYDEVEKYIETNEDAKEKIKYKKTRI